MTTYLSRRFVTSPANGSITSLNCFQRSLAFRSLAVVCEGVDEHVGIQPSKARLTHSDRQQRLQPATPFDSHHRHTARRSRTCPRNIAVFLPE